MAKNQQNLWTYVIIALIVGILIGYAAAGGFTGAGKAFKRGGTSADIGSTKECNCGGQTTLCSSTQSCDTCCSSGTGTPI